MTYPLLTLRDTSNVEIESIDFGIVGATGYSSEIELRVWNDYGAVEGSTTAYNVIAKLLNEDNEESGDPITQKWVEYKIGKAGDTATPEHIDTEWSVMGINSYPSLGTIQQNTYRTLYLRLHAPAGVSTGELTLNLSLGDGITPTILSDLKRIVHSGVFSEELFNSTGILKGGDVITYGNDTIDISRIVARFNGKLVVVPKTQVILNQEDVNEVALTNGESYLAVLSLNPNGTLTVTKGTKAESPTAPETPEGEIKFRTVTVEYGSTGSVIEESNITWDAELIEAGLRIYDSDTFELGKFYALLDDRYFEITSEAHGLLEDGYNWIHLTNSGVIGNVSNEPEGVLNLFRVQYSVGVASVDDLRAFIDPFNTKIKELVYNDTEATIPKGSICDILGLNTVTPSNEENSKKWCGIAESDILDEHWGYIVKAGRCEALTIANASVGDILATCSVDGYVIQNNSPNERENVGVLLEEVIENGLAFINI